jgi:hypothetical protein
VRCSLLSGSAVRACLSRCVRISLVGSNTLGGRLVGNSLLCTSTLGGSLLNISLVSRLLGRTGLSSLPGGDQLFGSLDSGSLLRRGF